MAKNPLIPKRERSRAVDVPNQSKGILDDFAVRKNVATQEGTIEKVPVNDSDIVNKKFVDDNYYSIADDKYVLNTGDIMTGDYSGLTSLSATTLYCNNLSELTGSAGITVNHKTRHITGTAAAPSIAATSYATTGIYWNAGPVFNIAIAGVRQFHLAGISEYPVLGIGVVPAYTIHARYRAGASFCLQDYRPTGTGFATNLLIAKCENDVTVVQTFVLGVLGAQNTGGTPATTYGYLCAGSTGTYNDNAMRVYPTQIGGADNYQVGFSDGVVGTPGVTFKNDLNTGLYRIGVDNFGFAAGGALTADVTSTQFRVNHIAELTSAHGIVCDNNLTSAGTMDSAGFKVGGVAGVDATFSILDGDGITSHDFVFTKGILTSYSTS